MARRRCVRGSAEAAPETRCPLALARPSTGRDHRGLSPETAERPSRTTYSAPGQMRRASWSATHACATRPSSAGARSPGRRGEVVRARGLLPRPPAREIDATPPRTVPTTTITDSTTPSRSSASPRFASRRRARQCAGRQTFPAGRNEAVDAAKPRPTGSALAPARVTGPRRTDPHARRERCVRIVSRLARAARAKSSSPDHASSGFAVDTARLRRSIRELNAVAGEGKARW